MKLSPLDLVFKLGDESLRPSDLEYTRELPSDFDFNNKTILLIDDNAGIVSFLEDDLETIFEDYDMDESKYNILSFVGEHAVYEFLTLVKEHADLNIDYAIIDLTLGGSILTPEGNIRLTGMDVFEVLHEINPLVKYFFYTGNLISDPINPIKNIIDQYNQVTKLNLEDKVLYKTEITMDPRRAYIHATLFKD